MKRPACAPADATAIVVDLWRPLPCCCWPCVVLALKLGAVPVSVTEFVVDLGRIALGRANELPTEYRMIVFDLRLPRILLGIFVGAALSVAGASFQALLRNPLADPLCPRCFQRRGAGFDSRAHHRAGLGSDDAARRPSSAPIATIAAVYFLGRREGQLDSTTLLLAGIITASFFSAIIMFLMTTLASRDLRGMVFLADGRSFHAVSAGMLWVFMVGLIAGDRRDLQYVRRFESCC